MRDRDFDLIRGIDKSYRELPSLLATDALKTAAERFTRGIDGAIATCVFPAAIASFACVLIEELAKHRGEPTAMSPQRTSATIRGELSEDRLERVCKRLVAHASVADRATIEVAIANILPNLVVGVWTAFETLCSDVWPIAFQSADAQYQNLSGHKSRIWRLAKSQRGLAVGPLVRGTNPSGLGDGAKNHGFASLGSIRESFSVLCCETYPLATSAAIDAALADNRLGAASILRNVFAHSAGKADPEYIDKSANFPGCPQCSLGDEVKLDGAAARATVGPVISLGCDLTTAVDKWILEANGK
jgi:hypothetical protein